MTPAVREQPVIEILHSPRGWYRLPAVPPMYMPDELSALAAARHIWPSTTFRIVDDATGAVLSGAPTVPGYRGRHRPAVDDRSIPPRDPSGASFPRRERA